MGSHDLSLGIGSLGPLLFYRRGKCCLMVLYYHRGTRTLQPDLGKGLKKGMIGGEVILGHFSPSIE